jgi:hypothetical protein
MADGVMPDLSTNPPRPKAAAPCEQIERLLAAMGITGRILVQLNCTLHALRPLHFQEAFGAGSCL